MNDEAGRFVSFDDVIREPLRPNESSSSEESAVTTRGKRGAKFTFPDFCYFELSPIQKVLGKSRKLVQFNNAPLPTATSQTG